MEFLEEELDAKVIADIHEKLKTETPIQAPRTIEKKVTAKRDSSDYRARRLQSTGGNAVIGK
ncbi:MAG: hypothetical protein RSA70_06965, partial [Clostridia bacterium]